jgi:hypothetical protein
MSKFSVKLSLVILLGSLNLGLAKVAQADVKWVESLRGFCPTVCQKTDYKFAMPGGINPKATKARKSESVYYVCAAHYSGWRIGYNINYQHDRCYTGFRGNENYGEVYLCLCTDKEMPPVGDSTGYIKRR